MLLGPSRRRSAPLAEGARQPSCRGRLGPVLCRKTALSGTKCRCGQVVRFINRLTPRGSPGGRRARSRCKTGPETSLKPARGRSCTIEVHFPPSGPDGTGAWRVCTSERSNSASRPPVKTTARGLVPAIADKRFAFNHPPSTFVDDTKPRPLPALRPSSRRSGRRGEKGIPRDQTRGSGPCRCRGRMRSSAAACQWRRRSAEPRRRCC